MSSEPAAPVTDDRALSTQDENSNSQDEDTGTLTSAQELGLTHEPDVDFRSLSTEAEEGASKFTLVPGPDTGARHRQIKDERTPPVGERTSQIHAAVWRLAWPSVLTMLLQTFNGLMDTLFVGHLPHSKQALAATGIGGQIIFLLISLAMGVSVGTTALVARFTGAKNHEDRLRAPAQSLTLSLASPSSSGCHLLCGARLDHRPDADGQRRPSTRLSCAASF